MRTTLATLAFSGILVCLGSAQDSGSPGTTNAPLSQTTTPGTATTLSAAALNRQVIEANVQFELLNLLAQEHRKRAEDIPRDQGRYQWESDLAKELGARAAALLSLAINTNQVRLTSEPTPVNPAASSPSHAVTGATNGPSSEEIAFLEALAARRTALQKEMTTACETASLYATRLATNDSYSDPSNLHYLIRENNYAVKLLQKELFDLELKHLEFRALRKP